MKERPFTVSAYYLSELACLRSKTEGYPVLFTFAFAGEVEDSFSSVIAHNVI